MHKFWQKARHYRDRFRKTEKLFARALQEWGWGSQMGMLAEESAELTVAVHHLLRAQTPENIKALASEMADVEIMLEQARFMHPDLGKLADECRREKLRRLRERLNAGARRQAEATGAGAGP